MIADHESQTPRSASRSPPLWQRTASGGAASGGAASGADSRDRQSVASSTTTTAAKDAVEYWTRKRMANAKPYKVSPSAATGSSTAGAPASRGVPVSVPPATGALGSNGPVPQAASVVARAYTNLPDRLNVKVNRTRSLEQVG